MLDCNVFSASSCTYTICTHQFGFGVDVLQLQRFFTFISGIWPHYTLICWTCANSLLKFLCCQQILISCLKLHSNAKHHFINGTHCWVRSLAICITNKYVLNCLSMLNKHQGLFSIIKRSIIAYWSLQNHHTE